MSNRDERLRYLDAAKTLGDLGTRALETLIDEAEIDPKWLDPLKMRLDWVRGANWTLEEAAGLVGVTRERMRQVQKALEVRHLDLPVPPRLVFDVLRQARSASEIEGFWRTLRDLGIAGVDEAWRAESLLGLFRVVADQESVDEFGRQLRRLSPPPRSRRVDQLIRKSRLDLLGMIDLSSVAQEAHMNIRDLEIAVRRLYPHVFGDESTLLAVQRPPGTFIATVGKQLRVNPEVSDANLFEGIHRIMAYRGITSPFSFEQFKALLHATFGSPPALSNLSDEFSSEVQLSEYESAWVGLFETSQRRTLHRDELVRVATREDLSLISAGVYLSTSPIIRPSEVKRGYFRLV